MSEPTRTELGYAWWKDDPKRVADARTAATGIIAQRKIKQAVVDLVQPIVDGMQRGLDRLFP